MRYAVQEEYATGRFHNDGSAYVAASTVCWCETRAMADAVAELWASRGDVRRVSVVVLMDGAPAHLEGSCASASSAHALLA